ncbi:Fumarate reductase subunit D [invertebrate metagenome]|uniref:Fumarate reductase subunit D n=1 Tax=invertebrate metagenome TaxID=1711999 RepID=A0A2H9T714_9ZZZZ
MSNQRHLEPVFWGLFGAGGVTAALFFPAVILIIGLGVPLGFIDSSALSYERMSGFFLNNWIGKILLMIALVPTYWHCIHRLYHSLHDFGLHPGAGAKTSFYGGALVLSIATTALLVIN